MDSLPTPEEIDAPPTPEEVDEIVQASPTPDMTVIVHRHGHENGKSKPQIGSKTIGIQVQRSKLITEPYFKAMLSRGWAESQSSSITLDGDHAGGILLLLRGIHGTLEEIPLDQITIEDVWQLVMVSDKYQVDRQVFAKWFRGWYRIEQRNGEHLPEKWAFERQVMFPCFAFGDAIGFQEATKELVYAYPQHIVEKNPTKWQQMHLPARVVQQLNAARGRLRTILHYGLFEDLGKIVNTAGCSCKEETVFEYLRELGRVRVWPMEEKMKYASVRNIIGRLRSFDEARMVNVKRTEDCLFCDKSWGNIVLAAAARVERYFDGLCLDCMDKSKNLREGGDQDDDYWHHNDQIGGWDKDCRVEHGQPTWYFSFMGRREKKGLIADM